MSGFYAWLYELGATQQALFIASAGFFIVGVGFLLIWIGTRGDEYKGVRRRWVVPDPYDRDPHTGEFLVPLDAYDAPEPVADRTQVLRAPEAFVRHVPRNAAPDTRAEVRHRLEDTQGLTTNLGAYAAAVKRYNARAMVPTPRPVTRDVGLERRTLRVDWRGQWRPVDEEEVEEDGDYPR